jgi:hypothetical protein
MADKTIVIATFDNEAEAEMARGFLQMQGIKSFITKDDVGGMYPGLQATGTGVSLRVRPRDAGRATEALRETEKSARSAGSDVPPENLLAILSLLAWLLLPIGLILILIGLAGERALIYVGILVAVIGFAVSIFLRLRKPKKELSRLPSKWAYFVFGLALGVVLTGGVAWYSGAKQRQYDGVYRRDLNKDGKTDEWITYQDGQIVRAEADRNFDGKIDVWWTYEDGIVVSGESDIDFNGVVDATFYYVDGVLYSIDFHPNGSEIVTKRQLFEHGVLKEEWVDKNGDGTFDERVIFDLLENPVKVLPFR